VFRRSDGLAAIGAAVVVAIALRGLPGEGSDACACGSTDEGALEAFAEERAERGAARSADEGALAGPDAALVSAVVVVVTAIVVVVAAAASVADAVVPVIALGHEGQGGRKEKRGDEDGLVKPIQHHGKLDAGTSHVEQATPCGSVIFWVSI